jgi:hypothetical protein
MKKIFIFSLVILAVSVIPSSFAWDGLIAMDADKRNVEFGDIISYEGYLYGDYPINEEPVYVTISEQETGKIISEISLIPNSTSVDYFENTAWPFSFQVGTSYQGFTDDMTYVVEAKYDDKSSELNFLIKPDTKTSLKEKATDASDAIVVAGTETGELIIETGKEAGKVIVKAGEDVIEKGAEVEQKVDQKRIEAKETVEQKASEVMSEIEETAGGGCLIATASFGSELSPQVQQLRELRDNQLLKTESGSAFMESFNGFYYTFSPTIADYERENPVFKESVKLAITPMISSLSILNYVEMDSELDVLAYGTSLIILNIGMYAGVPAIVVMGIKRKTNSFSLD